MNSQEPSPTGKEGVDWSRIEDAWFNAMRTGLIDLAKKYPEDEFYGAFFDCNSGNCGFQLHLNTEDGLREKAEEYRERNAHLYPGWSVEDLMTELRWSGGDWKYFGVLFPYSAQVEQIYSELTAIQNRLHEEASRKWSDEYAERYMEMCCRVVIRLEQSGVFDAFRRTPEFRVACVDEYESFEAGEERLNRIRASFQPR